MRALALDATRPEAYLAAGAYDEYVLHDMTKAMAHYAQGLRTPPPNIDLISRGALVEAALGQWDSSLVHMQRASQLDPRSVTAMSNLWALLASLRRIPEAGVAADRCCSPTDPALIENKTTLSDAGI